MLLGDDDDGVTESRVALGTWENSWAPRGFWAVPIPRRGVRTRASRHTRSGAKFRATKRSFILVLDYNGRSVVEVVFDGRRGIKIG